MHPARKLLAVLIAMFIALPACCCLGATTPPKTEQHSCCGSGKEKKETVCACTTAKHQKMADTDTPVPPLAAAALPALPGISIPKVLPLPDEPRIDAATVERGPPRLLLVRLQRFLI